MRGPFREYLKYCLTVIGARIKAHTLHQFLMVVNYMKIGLWMRNHGFNFDLRVRERNAIFSIVANQITDKKVLYLEFGVFKGKVCDIGPVNLSTQTVTYMVSTTLKVCPKIMMLKGLTLKRLLMSMEQFHKLKIQELNL